MNKAEFLDQLRQKLTGLPKQELEDRLNFYSEMIDDRIEEGVSEEDAVSDIGTTDSVAAEIIAGIPLSKIAKERIKPKRRLRAWEIVLLALGSPIWLSLLIAAFAVTLSLYVVLWSVIISIWVVFASLSACAFGGIIAGGIFAACGSASAGIAMIGASMVCAGLAIFLFFGCTATTKGIIVLTKKIAIAIKKSFIRKENAS